MAVVITEKPAYKNFGRTAHLTNGLIEADITLDIGPRILNFARVGGENIMRNDEERKIVNNGPEYDSVFGEGTNWYIYGGHRLWASPEKLPNSYFPDNVPVEFEKTERGGIFTQIPQAVNGIRLSIEVEMSANTPEMKVIHRIQNISDGELTLAPWALSVLERDGILIIPQNTEDTELLANRVMSVWPYTDLSDSRVYFGEKYITLRQDRNIDRKFKIGLDLHAGISYYVLGGSVFVKKYNHDKSAVYPDFGVSFETFTNSEFLEMESLGALETLSPGGSATHTELWSIHKKPCDFDPKNDESVAELAGKIK